MARDTRALRLKFVWLLVLPFLWFARPTLSLLAWGAPLAVLGLLLRAWAAGTIVKERELTTTGPYSYLRHPLYLGSLFIGVGVTVAGGHWAWPLVFLVFFSAAYGRTIRAESVLLLELFGDDYRDYAANVPGLIPRLAPHRAADVASGGFRFSRYARHKEWEALLGGAALFTYLTARAMLESHS